MSVSIEIKKLTKEQKCLAVKDLYVRLDPKGRFGASINVEAFQIDNNTIDIPFTYAVSALGLTPNEEFPQVDIPFRGELRDYQKQVRQDVFASLDAFNSVLLSLHVGWGKSVFALYLAHKLGLKTLIVVNKLILLQQWFDLVESLCPGSGKILKPKTTIDEDFTIGIVNIINIPKFDKSFLHSFGTLIADEIHMLCSKNMFKAFFSLNPCWVIGLSATPYRTDGLGKLIQLFFGDTIVNKSLSTSHKVYFITTEFSIKHTTTPDGKIDWNSVLNSQAEHPSRNQAILDIVLRNTDKNFLVLCKRIQQGEWLAERFQDCGETVTCLLGKNKEFDPEARICIATTLKCGVGFSHNKLNALLLASDIEAYFIQYLGRVFRTPGVEPIIFDLIDDHPVLRKHAKTRQRVYEKSGGKLKFVDLGVNGAFIGDAEQSWSDTLLF